MCGIAGIHGLEAFDGLNDATRRVGLMVDALAHRGPDAEGVWTDQGHVVLGHRRLSILDTGEGANQPFVIGDDTLVSTGRCTITSNCGGSWKGKVPIGLSRKATPRWSLRPCGIGDWKGP